MAPTVQGNQEPKAKRPDRRRPDLDTVFSINADGSRNVIHPADCAGRFTSLKRLLWWVLIGVYLAMPWVQVGGHPAVLIDIERRHFFLFGQTFNAQDFWLAFFFVTGLAFTLFVVAALWGRLWCGYACPQTVFLEGVFRRIEHAFEGPAASRAKLDRAPWTLGKVLRRGGKLAVFLLISLLITHSLLGYFMPVQDVVAAMTGPPTDHLVAFLFIVVLTGLVFVNFTWFREQTCIVVCPYGRLQGALYDLDTVVVGYDRNRGEPRGAVTSEGAGDCVDCLRCVAVCPTGIDIRNGTQMECVGCANCIDACDEVMGKLGRETGLVRYDSQRGFEHGQRRFMRPRVLLYSVLLAVGVTVFTWAATQRAQFEARLLRQAGTVFTVEGDLVRNVLSLHLVNKLPEQGEFELEAIGPAGADVAIAERLIVLDSLKDRSIPIIVRVPRATLQRGDRLEVVVRLVGQEPPVVERASLPLVGPAGR
jgi:cytochrome c oxidase accessory protein FixG